MSNTPNLGLDLVPSNSLQPSVAINESFKILDALVQMRVQEVADDPPTTDETDIGKVWLVGGTPTGAWVGYENHAALCTAAELWQFFEPGTQIAYLLRLDNGGFYKWDSGWVLAGGLGDAPGDGTLYGRKDGTWVEVPGGVPDAPADGTLYGRKDGTWAEVPAVNDSLSIITEASAFTATPDDHSGLSRYVRAGGDVTFDDSEGYAEGQVFNIRATAALSLVESGVTLTPTAGGTLALEAGMAVTVVMVTATTADVIGLTVAA